MSSTNVSETNSIWLRIQHLSLSSREGILGGMFYKNAINFLGEGLERNAGVDLKEWM